MRSEANEHLLELYKSGQVPVASGVDETGQKVTQTLHNLAKSG